MVVLAAAGLAKVLTALIRTLDGVTTAIAGFIRGIVDGIGSVVHFLTQDVPNAFRSGFAGIISVFDRIYRFLVRIKDEVVQIVQDIKDAIDYLESLPDRVWRGVKEAPGDIWDAAKGPVIDVLSQNEPNRGGVRAIAPTGVPGTTPTRSGVDLVAAEGTSRIAAVARRGGVSNPFDLHVRLDVDGETLARVTERVRQDDARRAFAPGAVG
jgi:hypothetical protein